MLIVLLNVVGAVSLLIYFCYVFFWKTKSLTESLENEDESLESLKRGYDKYSWALLIIGVSCLLLSDYLSGKSFSALIRKIFLGE